MRLCAVFCIVFAARVVYGQWASRVYLVEATNFFHNVLQKTILELEARGFSDLRLDDIRQTISQQMYKWLVAGNVTYTNGFVVSIQKLDVTDVSQTVSTSTVDGVAQSLGVIYGQLNIRDMKIGYDVIAELEGNGNHRFTGTFVHTHARYHFQLMKNLHTHAITGSSSLDIVSGGPDRMIYMPANNITQVISRTYTPSNIWDSMSRLGREVIMPLMVDIATNKLEFPPVCLDCR